MSHAHPTADGGQANSEQRRVHRALGTAPAQVVAWTLLALINVVAILLLAGSTPSWGIRLAHHGYDAGQLVFVGLVCCALVALWQRWVHLSDKKWQARAGYAAFAVAALVVAFVVLPEDLASFVARKKEAGSWVPWGAVLPIGAALGLVAGTAIARLLDRPFLRWLGLGAGVGLGVLHQGILASDYPGIHLLMAWAAALCIASSLASVQVPLPRVSTRLIVPVAVLVALGATVTVVLRPPAPVLSRMLRVPGAVLSPLLLRVLPAEGVGGAAASSLTDSPWFRDRGGLPPVAPGLPRIVPKDAIVIFLTIDAVRADVLADDTHAELLPALNALRDESINFTLARTPSPSTATSIGAFSMSKYYSQQYWTPRKKGARPAPWADDSIHLAQVLDKAGVKTVHVMAAHGIRNESGVTRGFAEELLTKKSHGHAREAMGLLMERLRDNDEGPLFIYLHFVEPHAPYDRGGKQGTAFERYLREIAVVDKEFAKLRKELDESGLASRTVLIVSADHGEAFGEHGKRYHATTIYEEVLRVPLLFKIPGKPTRRVDTPVTLVDLGPTILDLFGLPTPGVFMGQSLVPLLRGDPVELTRPIVVDSGRRMQAMIFPDGFKAIVDPRRKTTEVYDLRTDPEEHNNLLGAPEFGAERYVQALRVFFEVHTLRREGWEPPWRKF